MPGTSFASAARSFVELVREIPDDAWDGPGLGEWDLRALVGHAARSLTTVLTYLQTSAEHEDVTTPEEYYLRVTPSALGIDPADVAERGRQAGRDLGPDPAVAVERLADLALATLATAGDPLMTVIGGLGIRLSTYLPTRTFELVVHSLDIANATGIGYPPATDALAEAVGLATRIATATGHGQTLLLALTGRRDLPRAFSVV